ncbi:MAG: c-type cytochrome [Candidatus Krumholzibacteriia bacterium]
MNTVLVLLLTLWTTHFSKADARRSALPAAETSGNLEVHRALGLLQYVFGDYPLAVGPDGCILDAGEYEEQHELLREARAILARQPVARRPGAGSVAWSRDVLLRRLNKVQSMVEDRDEPGRVRAAVKALRDDLVDAYGLRLAPPEAPSLARGVLLYRRACAACHGVDGRSRTSAARRLVPAPTDLLADHLEETLSPYQVFNVVSFGIPGTAMPSFETLRAQERWDVAFCVLAMRHPQVGRSGRTRVAASPAASVTAVPEPTLGQLARFTDAELATWFAEHGVPAEIHPAAVARARHLPPH